MPNLTPTLRDAEAVIAEYGATVYQVAGNMVRSSNIRLWLTDQRLILKAGLGPQRSLPLYMITGFHEEKISWYTMIRIEFTDGHSELMTVQNQAQFLEQLAAAQKGAPEIPEGIVGEAISPEVKNVFRTVLIVIGIIAAVVLICSVLFVLVFGALWFLSLQG